jgi:hypothetical protein
MSTENNETMDVSTVCEMMEDIKASQAKQLTGIEKLLSKSAAAPLSSSASAPAITLEDRRRIDTLTAKLDESGERMETLTPQLDSVSEKLSRPLKHHHTLDYASNWALIALVGTITLLICALYVNHRQRDTIVRSRDNDLKYRYIQMQGEATPGDIERLETNFTYDRHPDSIRAIRKQVEQYERLVKEGIEKSERARLNASEAERLKKEAEAVKRNQQK